MPSGYEVLQKAGRAQRDITVPQPTIVTKGAMSESNSIAHELAIEDPSPFNEGDRVLRHMKQEAIKDNKISGMMNADEDEYDAVQGAIWQLDFNEYIAKPEFSEDG